MLLFFSLLGIFLSAILVYFNARKNPSIIYLGFFFLLISLYSLIQFVVLYSKSTILASIFFLNIGFVTYMIGPMLYWYVRSVLTDNSRLRKSDCWHFLPMLLFFALTLPHLFTPWSEKMEMASKIVENANNVWIINRNIFQKLTPAYIVFLSRPVLVLAYALASFILYVQYLKRPDKSRTLSSQAFMTKWLAVLFAFLFILILSHIGLILEVKIEEQIVIFYTLNFLLAASGIGLTGLLISPFFFPGVLYGLPRIPETPDINEHSTPEVPIKNKNEPHFEADYLNLIRESSTSCMGELQPFLQSEFNLAQLSVLIHVPVHHLAYYFREVKKQTFNDFRNEWRVEYAKNLIREGKSTDLTLEAIGLLSGFSSRNTFLNGFKKFEGISPLAFLNQIKEK